MRKFIGLLFASFYVALALHAQTAEHTVVVFKQQGRFAGWPANYGIWSWGNEVLVGFEAGYFHFRRPGEHEHSIDYTRPSEHLLARSMDGGETWTIEKPASLLPPPGVKVAGVPTEPGGKPVTDCPGGFDFRNPNFIATFRMADVNIGPSRFYFSLDRGKSFDGPYQVPDFGQKGIAARTDYLIDGDHDMTVFLTAAKRNGHEGRVICVRTHDGGRSWQFISFVTPEPKGVDHAIMPSSVRLSPNTIITAVRYRHWIDLYRSDDNAKTWRYVSRPAPDTDNPPSLVHLADGWLALTYGRRTAPFGIRARLSSDNGATWGDEIVLRQDGGSWDLGYTRSVQRPDGKIVTVYYFNDAPDHERQINATIWDPGVPERTMKSSTK
jgi:hypothetical protein